MSKRVFFQGDRDTAGREKEVAIEIMRRLGQLGWAANVGAYGGLVAAICESGVKVRRHVMDPDETRKIWTDGKAEIVHCTAMAEKIDYGTKEVAWGIRLGIIIETSDVFVFMPGREGTLAHLAAIIAFNAKGKNPKKIALVGWNSINYRYLVGCFDLTAPPWLENFSLDGTDDVIAYLTT